MTGPLNPAVRLMDESVLSDAAGEGAATPSAAELEALRGLGYVD